MTIVKILAAASMLYCSSSVTMVPLSSRLFALLDVSRSRGLSSDSRSIEKETAIILSLASRC